MPKVHYYTTSQCKNNKDILVGRCLCGESTITTGIYDIKYSTDPIIRLGQYLMILSFPPCRDIVHILVM